MAYKKVKNKIKPKGPAKGTKRNPDMDWATWKPKRTFGVYANLGTSYTHNGIRKFS